MTQRQAVLADLRIIKKTVGKPAVFFYVYSSFCAVLADRNEYFEYEFGGHQYDASMYGQSDGIYFIYDSEDVIALRDEKENSRLRMKWNELLKKKISSEI